MSPKRWILLLIFYISYLMFGASIYYHIEHNLETIKRSNALKDRIEMNAYLLDELSDKNATTQNEILQKISDFCNKPVTDYKEDEYEKPYIWTFYHSFFFAFTVCSTVGYGNISPSTTLGRMIMIAYSLIGIPVNVILFAGLGDYFAKTFQAIYRRYKKYKMSQNIHYIAPQLGLVTTVIIALIPGITIFILFPAWVFTYFEHWDYPLAIYYSYVTTTTIGFGDYVATFGPNQPREFGGLFVVYEIFVIVWFIFSLGYLVMIMKYITRGLQSKKLEYLEQQLSSNIKATHNRIWSGVSKDVGYLRRILNELYIMKFKPVYNEPDYSNMLHRSISCPELSMYRVDPPVIPRKRAFSECYDVIEGRADGTPFIRTASDTDLDKFDRLKSFENAEAFRQTTGLLAKVVSALATIQPPPPHGDSSLGSAGMYGGYHGFSDSQIMASEWSFPSVNAALPIPPKRGRACSDFNINPRWNVARPAQNEWTWSGGDNSQIQQAINSRVKNGTNGVTTDDNLSRENFARPPPEYVVNMDDEELTARKSNVKKFSIPDGLRKLFPFKKRNSQLDVSEASGAAAAASNANRKFSTVSVPEVQLHQVPPLDYYSTVTANSSATYFRDGRMRQPLSPIPQSRVDSVVDNFRRAQERYPSNSSLSSRLSVAAPNGGIAVRRESMYDAEQATLQSNASAYQRGVAAASRKRRESIFTQNPAVNARRGSMFPSTNAAAALTQRRGSLFNATDRRGSNATAALPSRRGSMFPGPMRSPLAPHERRPSAFSVASEEDRDVLENTTLADLIRALELMHTQAVMDEAAAVAAIPQSGRRPGGYKKRKTGNAGLDQPEFSPILSLFAGDKALTTAAANRLYARRSTIVGTMPSTMPPLAAATAPPTTTTNILTRRRPSSTQNSNDPPPSYSENDANNAASSGIGTKFKRRFSVRPTALQIPPGKAPPPNDSFNNLLLQPPTSSMAMPSTSGVTSQTVLQRRLSLRPSPLARELNTIPQMSAGASNIGATAEGTGSNPLSNTGRPNVPSSTTRLLPSTGVRSAATGTSSTHSPLSRIVQIAQAQRKSSAPEGFATERNKKPDGSK